MLRSFAGFIVLALVACGSGPLQSQANLSTKQVALCQKYCATSGSTSVCETKLSPYSDEALDVYDTCKGDATCVRDSIGKIDPGADALAFGKWTSTTCGLPETVKLSSNFARSVAAFSASVLNENKTNCESSLKAVATKYPNATTSVDLAVAETACNAAAYICFKAKAYTGDLCTAP